MKPIKGYTIVEQTEDKIVLEERFGVSGIMRIEGNPNPPPEEHQEALNKVGDILREAQVRNIIEEQKAMGV